MTATRLESRAIVRLAAEDESEDVRAFLQGLVTNDVSGDLPVYAALLSAQGKAMFDFLVWPGEENAILLDCEAEHADDLVKRLSLYRLRRRIAIERNAALGVFWHHTEPKGDQPAYLPETAPGSLTPINLVSDDPRLAALGKRWIASPDEDAETADEDWKKHRLSLGVPEGRAELGDILWLETNAVELNGVSFEKGCYIGQENTARMNWRNKVNRRLVVVSLDQSDEKRRKAAYPELGLAVDHLRVSDLDPATLPEWQAATIRD